MQKCFMNNIWIVSFLKASSKIFAQSKKWSHLSSYVSGIRIALYGYPFLMEGSGNFSIPKGCLCLLFYGIRLTRLNLPHSSE
ncbi:hypothetical protein GDO78_015388 [Eleutherodactylus coqui]|uniref:Uncharacterized protein n=1 Tax=Eleutherodactylus coqui TaxID=57060 RepID=A0A8J6BKN0_ELECQ|nr:hypothetical protein GDO78_015388 [Eleutherodactylus coqui]